MPPQEVRKVLTDRPFIPFRIHVSDGSSYDVPYPADAFVEMLYITVGIDPDDSGLFRRTVRISPNHISRLEMLPASDPTITAGREQ